MPEWILREHNQLNEIMSNQEIKMEFNKEMLKKNQMEIKNEVIKRLLRKPHQQIKSHGGQTLRAWGQGKENISGDQNQWQFFKKCEENKREKTRGKTLKRPIFASWAHKKGRTTDQGHREYLQQNYRRKFPEPYEGEVHPDTRGIKNTK